MTEASYVISQGLFLKAVAFIYFIAFASLVVQVKALYGIKGIVPIHNSITMIKTRYHGKNLYLNFPSIFLAYVSDQFLVGTCWLGMLLSFLVFLGVYPAIVLTLLFILYYSFFAVGAPFLNFQWDILLLEVGFLSIFYAIQSPPPPLMVYLMWFLLFRFMFSSGIAKILLGSKEWRDLSAMDFHYETQPLPTKWGYYAHHQPKMLLKWSTLSVYFFELVVPFFIFTVDQLRVGVFVLFAAFQLMIQLTGNFTFFNLLSIVMGIPLLSDAYLGSLVWASHFTPLFEANHAAEWMLNGFALLFIFLNALELMGFFYRGPIVRKVLAPFHFYNILNPYGLFVHMTTYRDEIIIEGSNDGTTWEAYEFRWKPGDPSRPPRRVAPHQPRLDWQMWFAALSSIERNPWLVQFMNRLLEGSEDVIALLKTNPFPDKPPKYIRSSLYRYHFTDLKTKRETGDWWVRRFRGEYSSIFSLRENRASNVTYFY